jgi:hypothetical protein
MRWGMRGVRRVGPYFIRYSASVRDRGRGASAGWTSQGFKLGRLTVNTTTGRWSYDTPGPGSGSGEVPDWVMRALPTFLTRQPDGSPFFTERS